MTDFTGADLEQLDELATAFTTAGNEIAAKAATLHTRIQAAVENFDQTLSTMQTEASTLGRQMDDEMAAVQSAGQNVRWTGTNRVAFDGDLASFTSVVQRGTSQIDSDIVSIKSQVDTRFNPVLTEFGTALTASADDVGSATTTMKAAVDTQRANLDQSANVGWTSA